MGWGGAFSKKIGKKENNKENDKDEGSKSSMRKGKGNGYESKKMLGNGKERKIATVHPHTIASDCWGTMSKFF